MLKLIIVDDEKITRDGLEQHINWEEFGITNVATAKNGVAALELAHQMEPDIVITDVRMPKMDGIEFSKRVREFLPECKIIFLSGYSDKEYLKSAIQLKAINYIEKPINIDEIRQVVKDTAILCMEEFKKKTETEKLKNSFTGSIPFIRQEIALELAKENADIKKLASTYEDPIFHDYQDTQYTAAFILLNLKPGIESERFNSVKRGIYDMFCDSTKWSPLNLVAGFMDNEKVIVFYHEPNLEETAYAAIKYEKIPEKILENLSTLSEGLYEASIGLGRPVKGLASLTRSCREAFQAVKNQFYSGKNRVYPYEEHCPGRFNFDKSFYASFKEFLKAGNRKAASDLVNKLTSRVKAAADPDTDFVKNIYFNLLLLIFEAARERELLDTAVENEKGYIWREIDALKTLTELSDYILKNINAAFNRPEGEDSVNRTTLEVMRYIRENFSNRDLTIQTIANNSYLSQTYLCSFFKKATGKTINEYITEVRIEKAKELLMDSRSKLYEITAKIGFTDTNYFSTLFKKCVGCTPSEFREKSHL